jgi:hypothetical protein
MYQKKSAFKYVAGTTALEFSPNTERGLEEYTVQIRKKNIVKRKGYG